MSQMEMVDGSGLDVAPHAIAPRPVAARPLPLRAWCARPWRALREHGALSGTLLLVAVGQLLALLVACALTGTGPLQAIAELLRHAAR